MIITTDEVKTLLQITGTTKDDLIDALIPMIQDEVIEYCNHDFLVSGVESWPVGMKIPAAKMIGFTMAQMSGGGTSIGLQSETQGGYSYTRESNSASGSQTSAGYPPSIYTALDKWKRVSVKNPQAMTQFRDRREMTLKALSEGKEVYSVPGVPL